MLCSSRPKHVKEDNESCSRQGVTISHSLSHFHSEWGWVRDEGMPPATVLPAVTRLWQQVLSPPPLLSHQLSPLCSRRQTQLHLKLKGRLTPAQGAGQGDLPKAPLGIPTTVHPDFPIWGKAMQIRNMLWVGLANYCMPTELRSSSQRSNRNWDPVSTAAVI